MQYPHAAMGTTVNELSVHRESAFSSTSYPTETRALKSPSKTTKEPSIEDNVGNCDVRLFAALRDELVDGDSGLEEVESADGVGSGRRCRLRSWPCSFFAVSAGVDEAAIPARSYANPRNRLDHARLGSRDR